MNDIRRLGIVNRGEPAMRLLTAVAELNRADSEPDAGQRITTVALYTDPDSEAWFVQEADEAVCLGPATYLDSNDGHRKSSYLDEAAVVKALVEASCDAVWVGWGFVSERASFAQRCEEAGIVFVGPDSATIRALGDKITAKRLAEKADVPVLPWGGGPVDDPEDAAVQAERLGYPVILKASAGGGGRGIRVVRSPEELAPALASARAEAELAFGDPAVFLERYVESARHVEVQVIADCYGTAWAVGVRDCSIQRRNQKVIEESASTALDDEAEAAIKAAAVRLATAVHYRSAGTIEFLVDPVTREFLFMEANTRLQVEHPVTEATTGLDLVKLQLHVAAGGRLEGEPPPVNGHAVEARLCAEDPEQGFVPAPGRIAMLRLPTGSGVRVDSGVRECDTISAEFDSMIAKIVAWGQDRDEALARLRRALAQSAVVVEGGTTNRSFLLGLLDRPELRSGDFDNRWLDRLTSAGEHVPPAQPVALLAAAVEAYAADHAAAQAAFHAGARRGRPEVPESVGIRVQLRYKGVTYDLAVYRTSPGTYRVRQGNVSADLSVDFVNAYERRVRCAGRFHRVVAVTQGAMFRIVVDGTTHRVTRDDGGVVRAGWPAFVVSVLVKPGDQVVEGDPVAVLESMKMESTVAAPYAGEVAAVEVVANAQVSTGAPLLRIRAAEAPVGAVVSSTTLDLTGLESRPAPGTPPCDRVFGSLRHYLLGYDLDPATQKRLFVEQRRLGEISPPADAGLLRCEDSLLDLFAEVGSLYRPRTETHPDDALTATSTQEYLLAYLQWMDADRAGIPDAYRARLEAALAHYGVQGLERTPELDAAVVWMFRSFSRVGDLVPVVLLILERRLRAGTVLMSLADADMRARLDRVATSAQGRYQGIADLARDVRFHYFDEPVLEALVTAEYAETERALDASEAGPEGEGRKDVIDRLVRSPHPQRGALLRRWLGTADPRFQRLILEVYARRFYRQRELRDLDFDERDGYQMCFADYDWENKHIHLVVAYTELGRLPELSRAVAAHLADVSADRQVVVDLATWRTGSHTPIDETAPQVEELLDACDFGREPWRVDVTVTTTGGEERVEHFRTLHMSYRPKAGGGLREDLLYRNLHPMLAKRLDLWRLSNFRLERLASAEDVYLFHGLAHENPKDHRLFALAEVRDLTPVHDSSGVASYPWMGRMGLQALAAMRAALTTFPPRERPKANRIVLYVRPPWDVPRESWPRLARSFAPLAEGADLEKVLLRVRIPKPDGSLHDAVIDVQGVGGGGVTVQERPPGDEPVRPLTPYLQKVLVAQRFGVPYPYEIVRMLTAEPGASANFPPGSFVEHDLGPDGSLEPVTRLPGLNTANVVVGVLTNRTAKVPEGMSRVAVLSDPTRGLGNLAEPECRRILAALDLAERMQVPVEWFTVSSGALIAMDSGTENMDWIADVLRGLIEFTQRGGEINIVVTGINVGGQPYWNAEATMLMHTRGILVMLPTSAMVLTGKQALDFSGGVSADDNLGIGGFDRVMGPNGQAQYWAPSIEDACRVLLRHYDHTYVVPGERFPRCAKTSDPVDRDVRTAHHPDMPGSDLHAVGDIFSAERNLERKKPFDIRAVLRAVADVDSEPLERWTSWRGGETAVVWDAHIGGIPVCMLGLESRTLARRGYVPADGPSSWSSGTLFPQSARKAARAINAASGNRPLVVLANLSGFDGSPESMRHWQLEYGAEIGRAVTNFAGPIVFVVISRYHGGAFVVFSKRLNPLMEIAAVEGSYASVIGGAPAAATVFAREVRARTESDPRVVELREAIAGAEGPEAGTLRAQLMRMTEEVRSEKLGQVADEFDAIHTIDRALRVGSVDRIIPAAELRPYIVDALERGMAQVMAQEVHPAGR
ncbi:MAG TPA: carboxyl transferase domain-containing protein [Nocardioidaceae bacterium]|nr:carboxyl transferase domain-containing protein [Nocardioidaceae bacterium]